MASDYRVEEILAEIVRLSEFVLVDDSGRDDLRAYIKLLVARPEDNAVEDAIAARTRGWLQTATLENDGQLVLARINVGPVSLTARENTARQALVSLHAAVRKWWDHDAR